MPDNEPVAPEDRPHGGRLTVSQVTRLVKNLLDDSFPVLAVEGELSNYVHHSSGHRYFTLKDSSSQLRCVMFRWQAEKLDFRPTDGAKLLAVGNLTVYEAAGQYQLNVVRLQPLGRGDLLARLEELKNRLAGEGVFARKRPLPQFPSTVGVITSPTGAAVRDIISILGRRAPHVRVIVRPTLVQGDGAADDIVRAVSEFNRFDLADVLIVGRGGGSIEDLWCFNEETVARALASSGIPVISAVGHETDVTLADFAADLRAPTPSAAAELVVRDAAELRQALDSARASLRRAVVARIDDLATRTVAVRRALEPERFVRNLMSRGQRIDDLSARLKNTVLLVVSKRGSAFEALANRLRAMNPESVLARGYAIVSRADDGRIVTDEAMVAPGDDIRIRLAKGGMRAAVRETGSR